MGSLRLGIAVLAVSVGIVAGAVGQSLPPAPTSFASICESVKGRPSADPTKKTVDALIGYTVRNLGSLEDLGMELNCQTYEDILTKFDQVSLSDKGLSDLGPLTALPQLAAVSLYGNSISDVAPLSTLLNLRMVGLGRNQVHNLQPIGKLTNLEVLDVSANGLTDLSALGGLKRLKKLIASFNGISDLGPLVGLTKLEDLNLSGNSVKKVQPVSALSNLKRLDLSRNQIQDVTPLSALMKLDQLNLQSNAITDISQYQPNSTKILIFTDNPIPEQQLVALKARSKISGSPLLCIYYGSNDMPKKLQ
jgi:hypothetical protein